MHTSRKQYGFTIIELLVVIVVISILAAIVVVSYGGWRTSINTSAVKSDLTAAATAMENARNQDTGFPSSIPNSFTASQNVVITLASVSAKEFCINGSYSTTPSIQYYVDQVTTAQKPQAGTCASRVIASVPAQVTNVTVTSPTSTQVRVQWSLASPNYATGYKVECAQDAAYIIGRVTSTAAGATTVSTIISGVNSQTSYFCRVQATNTAGSSPWSNAPYGNTLATTCAESGQYGTYPSCHDYDSLAVGSSISGYWSTPPEGYLLEDGSAVSRTLYPDLFALIGTTYGIGDGFSTFNLPDSRGRATVNISSTDTEFNTMGEEYGEKNHTLTTSEMPSHAHNQYVTANSGGTAVRNDWSSDGGSLPYAQGIGTASTGNGTPYSVLQPSIVKRYAIKYQASDGSASTLPPGTTLQGYWSSTPSGYYHENGATVSRTTYATLFTAIGDTYGAGDGSTTFEVPDSRGRVGVNLSPADSYFGALGQLSGEKRHTLTLAEMVSHNHWQYITALSGGTGIRNDYAADANGGAYDQGQLTGSQGGGQSHNVIQPSLVKRSAVRTSASSGSNADVGPATPGTSIEGWWATVPTGYLQENGAAVSRTTYAALFAAIGTTHGAGDGSTTFNLPDSRGRVAVNLNPSDTEFNTIGEKSGAKTHIMTIGELPSHWHEQYVTANSGCCAIRRDYKSDSSGNTYPQNQVTGNAGSSAAFNVTQPSITKMFAIKF